MAKVTSCDGEAHANFSPHLPVTVLGIQCTARGSHLGAIQISPSSRRTWVTGRADHCVIYLDSSRHKEDEWEILLLAGTLQPRLRTTEPTAPDAQWRGTGRKVFLHLRGVTRPVTGMAFFLFLWSSLQLCPFYPFPKCFLLLHTLLFTPLNFFSPTADWFALEVSGTNVQTELFASSRLGSSFVSLL